MPTTPISPKVKAGLNWGVIATLLVTILSTITPDMLHGLGVYAPLVYGAIGTGTAVLAGYLKSDPLRDAGLAAQAPVADPAPVAPAASFAPVQAKLDALPAEVTPILPVP
jgi:hypothetical protein